MSYETYAAVIADLRSAADKLEREPGSTKDQDGILSMCQKSNNSGFTVFGMRPSQS